MRQRTPAPPKGKKKKKASRRIADGYVRWRGYPHQFFKEGRRICERLGDAFVLGRELARRSLKLSIVCVCVCGLAFLPPKEVTKRSSSYGILEKRRSWVVVEKLALEKLHYCLPSFAKFRPQGKEPGGGELDGCIMHRVHTSKNKIYKFGFITILLN
jgi:hypothetical protein